MSFTIETEKNSKMPFLHFNVVLEKDKFFKKVKIKRQIY